MIDERTKKKLNARSFWYGIPGALLMAMSDDLVWGVSPEFPYDYLRLTVLTAGVVLWLMAGVQIAKMRGRSSFWTLLGFIPIPFLGIAFIYMLKENELK